MRITKLEMQNVGPFEDVSIDFQPNTNQDEAEIHIFTGVNGSGKSTILYALADLFGKTPVHQRLHSANSTYSTKIEPDELNDRLTVYKKRANTFYWDYDTELEFAAFAYTGYRTLVSGQVPDKKSIGHPLSHAVSFRTSDDSEQLIKWIADSKTRRALALEKDNIEQADLHDRTIREIEKIIFEVTGLEVGFTRNDFSLDVELVIDGKTVGVEVLPDGLKSMLSWVADLLMRMSKLNWIDSKDILERPFILFLDEIEIHLHPAWQRKILPVVQKLFKNAQIFIATHSPFVVASVDDAWVYKLELQNGHSTVAQVTQSMAGSSYPYVLDEIFGIDEYFDVETEAEFERFYELRDAILKSENGNRQEFDLLCQSLSERSPETRDIIFRELRQLDRIIGEGTFL